MSRNFFKVRRALVLLFSLVAAVLEVQASAEPYLTLGINQQSEATVYRGWPILFTLEVLRSDSWQPNSESNEFTLVPGPNGWNSTLQLMVTTTGGSPVLWPAELVGDDHEPVSIEWGGAAEFGWWIHPEQSMGLEPGEYEVSAELDTSESVSGWMGKTNSPAARVRIEDEPAPLPAELVAEKHILLAYHAFWTGETNQAVLFLEELLAEQPANVTANSMRGDAAAAAGEHTEALEFHSRALQQFYLQNPEASEPPVELVRKHRASLAKALTAEAVVIIVRREGAELVLEWNGSPGAVYRVEASEDLQSWTPLQEGITAAGSTVLARVPIMETLQFLRVGQ